MSDHPDPASAEISAEQWLSSLDPSRMVVMRHHAITAMEGYAAAATAALRSQLDAERETLRRERDAARAEVEKLRELLAEVRPTVYGGHAGNAPAWLDSEWWAQRSAALAQEPKT